MRQLCLVAVILVAAEVGVHSDGRGLGQRHISVAAMREMPTAMMVWWLPQGGSDVMGRVMRVYMVGDGESGDYY